MPADDETSVVQEMFCPRCGGRFPGGGVAFCTEDGASLLPVGQGDDLSGTVLGGKYILLNRLGAGAFGAVYRAYHRVLHAEVAVKVLHANLQEDAKVRKQFLKEARVLMDVQSAHVVAVRDADEDEQGRLFIVMELMKGMSLDEYVRLQAGEGERLPLAEVIEIAIQVCRGLQDAHEAGVVHRDLKPSNVMVIRKKTGERILKIVDFGIARLAAASGTDTTITESMPRVLGTPAYMSPEQCKAQPVDHRADLYSLGVMLYELLSGCRPFKAPTSQALIIAHVTERPQPPSAAVPEAHIPPALDDLVMALMEKDPEKRPRDAAEVARRFQQIADSLRAGKPSRRVPWVLWPVVAVGVAGLAAAAWWLSAGAGSDEASSPEPPRTAMTARPADVRDTADVLVPVTQVPDIVETPVQAAVTPTVQPLVAPGTPQPTPRPTPAPRPSKKGTAASPAPPAPVVKGPAPAADKPAPPPPPQPPLPVTAKPEEPVRSPAKIPPARVSPDTVKPDRPRNRTTLEGRTGGAFDELEEMERRTR